MERLQLTIYRKNDLKTTNTNFQKRNGKLWTFMSDYSVAKSHVDYIMVRNKWRNSTKNCEAYNSLVVLDMITEY